MKCCIIGRVKVLAGLLLFVGGASSALAVNYTWNGGGADDLWTSAANWNGATVAAGANALFFDGSARLTPSNNLAADSAFNAVTAITFQAGAGVFTLSGNRITLGGNVSNLSSNLQTIDLDLIVAAQRSFTGGSIEVSGDISGAGGMIAGAATTLILSGNNTHSGTTAINSGAILNLGGINALGASTLVVAANGSLDNTTGSLFTATNNVHLSGGSLTYVGSNALNLSGTTTMSVTARTITVTSNTLTLSGVLAESGGSRNLTKAGTGTLVLGGVNTYSGTTFLTAGTLGLAHDAALGSGVFSLGVGVVEASGGARIINNTTLLVNTATVGGSSSFTFGGTFTNNGSNRVLVVNNTGTTTLAGLVRLSEHATTGRILTISGSGNTYVTGTIANGSSGAGSLIYNGSGTLALSSANTYSGTTQVSAGVVAAANDQAFGSGTIVINGGTLVARDSSRTFANALTLGFPTGNIGAISGTNAIAFNGLLTGAAATAPAFEINNTALTTFAGGINISPSTSVRTMILAGTGNILVSSTIANGAASTGNLTYAGSGRLSLAAFNAYNGTTTITGGKIVAVHANAFGTAPAFAVNGGELDVFGHSYTLASFSGSSGGIVTSGTTGGVTLTLAQTQTTVFDGSIQDGSGTIAVTKSGVGRITFSGSNNYSGPTNVNAGVLVINGYNANSAVTVAGGAVLAGSGTLGGPVTVSGTLFSGTGVNATGASTLTINNTLDLQAGSTTLFELSSASSNDHILGITDLQLHGLVSVSLIDGFIPGYGNSFNLFTWTGTLDASGFNMDGFAAALPVLEEGLLWNTGNFLTNGSISVVPEPSMVGYIFGVTAMFLVLQRLRRRSVQ